MKEAYENPLITRYASKEMSSVLSDNTKFTLWRKLWIALAEGEKALGLDITDEQIEEMKENISPINYDVAEKKEKEVRHDVMAHIYAYGTQCPKAMPIIHLGATSCYVGDNTDIIVYRDALAIIEQKLVNVIDKLAVFAEKYKSLPTLGFTHLQPAQLVTVGKRATLWIQDLLMDLEALQALKGQVKMRGVKGTTGTQASFLQLFDGDYSKVKKLNEYVVKAMGFEKAFAVTGQTYPRKLDSMILSALSSVAESAYKFSNDIRLLQNMKEIEEPFEKSQIGSSAMAYKRNPMRSERISSLARFVVSLPINGAITASTQWFERTLDDSANRRIVMAQAFLAVDAVLEIYLNVADGLVVYDKVINKHVMEELPFMATEAILMECVKCGGNRQELHEKIRVHSMEAGKTVKLEGKANDLIDRIKEDPAFNSFSGHIDEIMKPENFIGFAPRQVDDFISNEVAPVLLKYKSVLGASGRVNV
jgi:adenylosuccinate lyase